MENKILIKLTVEEIDHSFDVFIPVNEVIWKIKKMLIKSVNDIINTNFDLTMDYTLVNKRNGRIYKNNEIVIDTDIKNTSELIILTDSK